MRRDRGNHGLQVDGNLIPRGRRISLSFRIINRPRVCTCHFPECCDSRS